MKYIHFREHGCNFDSVIVFPDWTPHDTFRGLNVISAGFCLIHHSTREITVYGESVSLKAKSDPSASALIKKLIFKEI